MTGKVFYNKLINTLESVSSIEIKAAIGDSINNNRTLTVNQVIRYLQQGHVSGGLLVGDILQQEYYAIRPTLVSDRKNNRTDAIDINEFLFGYLDIFLINDSSNPITLIN